MLTTFVLAQAAQQQPPSGPSMLIPFIAIGVIFYFLIIRPQQKKAKEQLALINALKTGDKVVTSSGIHGLITNVKEKTVLVKVADNVKIEFEKASIAAVTKADEAAAS